MFVRLIIRWFNGLITRKRRVNRELKKCTTIVFFFEKTKCAEHEATIGCIQHGNKRIGECVGLTRAYRQRADMGCNREGGQNSQLEDSEPGGETPTAS